MAQNAQGNDVKSAEIPIEHSIPRLDDGASNWDGIGHILNHLFPNVPGSNITELLPAIEG